MLRYSPAPFAFNLLLFIKRELPPQPPPATDTANSHNNPTPKDAVLTVSEKGLMQVSTPGCFHNDSEIRRKSL